MRVLQVTPGYAPQVGGVQRHVQAISERLAALGHQVVVAAMAHKGEGPPFEVVNGVEIRRFFSVGVREAYRIPVGFFDYLAGARVHFDVVHAHSYHASMIPLAAALAARQLVVTPHLNDQPHSTVARLVHYPYLLVGRWSMRRARAVICVSEAERARVTARLGVDPGKTLVIPNGVEGRLFEPALAACERDPHLLLSVARLEQYKRIESGIAALAALPDEYRLVVIGQGSYQAALEARAKEYGVQGRVTFTGYVPDEELAGWYQRAQVALSLSSAEAFGMTVLEAIAGGCQAVCSDIPAYRNLAEQFPQFVSVMPSLAQAELAATIVAAAQRPTQKPADLAAFSWETVVAKTVRVYQACLGEPASGQAQPGQRETGHAKR